jgi:hypothetical protein
LKTLKLVEWGVLSQNEFIPLEDTSTENPNTETSGQEKEDTEKEETEKAAETKAQTISINELMQRLSNELPDTKIRAFKVPAAIIRKVCPPKPAEETIMDTA